MSPEHAMLAGGGSGGHVFPALAVADELEQRGWQVSWLGRSEGLERELVERYRRPYYGLPSRAVAGRSSWQKVAALLRLGTSAWQACRLIRQLAVDVVLGTGGYVSAPGVLGARLARRPTVLLEPNATPGLANRWLSRFATAAAVASGSSAAGLRCPARTTGVPVRREFLSERAIPATSGALRVLVLGGSQGARQLNRLLPSALAKLEAEGLDLVVTHQVGAALRGEAEAAYRQQGWNRTEWRVVPFLDDMAEAMAAADLVISRAGAITLAEICAVGRASLLLPLSLADSHQLANARRLVEAGAAEMLPATQLSTVGLAERMKHLLGDRPTLERMGAAARTLSEPAAAAAIADLMTEVVRAA